MQPQMPMSAPGVAQNAQLAAAMMWQMQHMQAAAREAPPNPSMMMPPWPPTMPGMPVMSPVLKVRVEGLKFEYQLTEDDVRKVFARYGEVRQVILDKEGTSATIQLEQPHQAVAAQHDLDNKPLSGMSGAFLRVEFASQGGFDPAVAQMAAAAASAPGFGGQPFMPPSASGYSMMPPATAQTSSSGRDRPSRKNTCKLEVGIENDDEFRVASRVIQVARQIWQDKDFQSSGGKTRLRGKGIGGPHEADEPLALCISCMDQLSFDKAVAYADSQLQKIHNDYRLYCQQNGRPTPDLSVRISRKPGGPFGPPIPDMNDFREVPRGERPPNAPPDADIELLIEERNEARKSQNFARADEVREYLKSRGVVLMDEKAAKGNLKGKEVTRWRFWRP